MKTNANTKKLLQIVAAAIALLMLVCLMLPILYADAIFEPQDKFYERHREEMTYIDKAFKVTQDVNGYESPTKHKVVITASPGTSLYISHAYTDENGVTWGVNNVDWTTCWFRLDELSPIYDTRDFLNDHRSELKEYTDQLHTMQQSGEELTLWSYPGSESTCGSVAFDALHTPSNVYTDPQGNDWLYFPYIFGMEGWIYTADPQSKEPVDLEAPLAEATPAPTQEPIGEVSVVPDPTQEPLPAPSESAAEEQPDNEPGFLRSNAVLLVLLAVLAVGFVVVLSVILILVFFVLNKKKNG